MNKIPASWIQVTLADVAIWGVAARLNREILDITVVSFRGQ